MPDGYRVVLTVPALGEFARTVRIAAAELATRAGMDLDDIEDVRLAVEEAFVFASERIVGGDLTFTFDISPGVIELEVTRLAAGSQERADAGERYARFILESICDEFDLVEEGETAKIRIVKRKA